jgi:YqaJ-like viral recombinase domain
MKRKLGFSPPVEQNWRMKEGNEREPWGAELYYRIMGFCRQPVRFEIESFRRDWQDHRLGGSPDRIVIDAETGERWLLEIKTCPGGDMRTEIPIGHLMQVSWWNALHVPHQNLVGSFSFASSSFRRFRASSYHVL